MLCELKTWENCNSLRFVIHWAYVDRRWRWISIFSEVSVKITQPLKWHSGLPNSAYFCQQSSKTFNLDYPIMTVLPIPSHIGCFVKIRVGGCLGPDNAMPMTEGRKDGRDKRGFDRRIRNRCSMTATERSLNEWRNAIHLYTKRATRRRPSEKRSSQPS